MATHYPLDLLENIYEECLTKPEEERVAFIKTSCGDNHHLQHTLMLMLSNQENAKVYFQEFQKTIVNGILIKSIPAFNPGDQVGNYTILKLIGRGGMSNVYLANRSDGQFEQQVAIKCLPIAVFNQETIAFQKKEQQILAKFQHPGIATLLDAGVSKSNVPYFVMEYINGTPIDVYINEKNFNQQQRLQYFLHVADAVSYAHSRFILHLDLKAANILVTDSGQVKLLDFGISSPFNSVDNSRRVFMGTPQIAAPEQITNNPSTVETDIYQLGSLLHKLTTGKLPLDESLTEQGDLTRQNILSTDFTKKSISTSLDFELSAIISKCLAVEPTQRYASIHELTEDILNKITHHPVKAVPPSNRYRVRKYVKRNHKMLLGFILIAVSLLTGTVVSLWQANIAKQQSDLAMKNEKISSATKNFLTDLFMTAHPSKSKGDTLTVFQFLDRGFEEVDSYNGSPEIKLEMLTTMANLYRSLGNYKKSKDVLEKAFALASERDLPISKSYIQAIQELALYHRDINNYDSAKILLNEVMSHYHRIEYPEQDSVYTNSLKYLAFVMKHEGNLDSAMILVKKAIALEEAIWPAKNTLQLAESYYVMGTILKDQFNYLSAIDYFSKSLQLCESLIGTYHPGTLANITTLASSYMATNQFKKALQYARRTPDIAVRLYGEYHSETGITVDNLGVVYLEQKQYDSAYIYFNRGLQIRTKIYSNRPTVNTIISLNHLVLLFSRQNQLDSAKKYLKVALKMSTSDRIQNRQRIHTNRLAGDIHYKLQRYDSATFYYTKSLMDGKEAMPEDDERIIYVERQLHRIDSILVNKPVAP